MLEYIPQYIRKDFFQLIYHVTFRCNARCNFCFNWKDLNKNKKNELSLDEINKISHSMPNFPWLLLSGGEPLLRDDLEGIIGIFYVNNKIKHLTLPTNGLLPERIFNFTNNILKKYKNLTITISFSLDALNKEHDKMRGIDGCYKKVIESYNSMISLRKNNPNLNLKFNTVISNVNYKSLKKLINKVRMLKPDMHTIDFIRGNLKDKNIKLPPPEEIENIIKIIKNNYDYYKGYSNIKKHSWIMPKISILLQKSYLDVFKEIIDNEKQVIPCFAYKTSLVLYPYGDSSFCEPLKGFANFRDYNYDYEKLIKSKQAKKQIELIKNNGCYCYHPCCQYLNILFSPKKIVKEVIRNVF